MHLHGFRKKETAIEGRETLDYLLWDSLKQVTQTNDVILLQPAALAGQWRLFAGVKNTFLENGQEVNDVGFIFTAVKKLIDDGVADPSKVYLTGISDGAIMAYHLLCQTDSPFAAAVTIVGSMYEKHLEDCDPKYSPPLMVIAGTNDPILPYDGWIFKTGREISIPETMNFWRNQQGCTGQKAKLLEDIEIEDNSRVRIVEWTNCKIDGAIKLLRAEGSGHAVPDFKQVSEGWLKRSGGQNRDISSAQEAWNFLRKFNREN